MRYLVAVRTTTVALGFKGRIGRAAVVAVAARSDGLEVVAKRRLDLATTFEEGAVYHVAQELPLAKASAMISAAAKKFERDAGKLVAALLEELTRATHHVDVAGIIWGSPKPLPRIETILKSHALIHSAEGELYRSVFAKACEAFGLRVVRVPSKELEARARAALGVSGAALVERLAALGKASGRPWAADQKQSTLAAMVALGRWHNLSGLVGAGRR
jgi:hypothetical protein